MSRAGGRTRKPLSRGTPKRRRKVRGRRERPAVGWREWVGLPDLGIPRIKAKLDTGARTSSLHAFDMVVYQRAGSRWIRFRVHPFQRRTDKVVAAKARVLEYRTVRSSDGRAQRRPVVETTLVLAGRERSVLLTLASRDVMGFRLLLGRQALRGQVLVDPGKSFAARGGHRPTENERNEP